MLFLSQRAAMLSACQCRRAHTIRRREYTCQVLNPYLRPHRLRTESEREREREREKSVEEEEEEEKEEEERERGRWGWGKLDRACSGSFHLRPDFGRARARGGLRAFKLSRRRRRERQSMSINISKPSCVSQPRYHSSSWPAKSLQMRPSAIRGGQRGPATGDLLAGRRCLAEEVRRC